MFEPYTKVVISPEGAKAGSEGPDAPKVTSDETSATPKVRVIRIPPNEDKVVASRREDTAPKKVPGAEAVNVRPPDPPSTPLDPKKPTARQKSSGNTRKASQQEPYRDFIVSYQGEFVGHYRSSKRVTNRTAFQKVARVMMSSIDDFELEKLRLYRPVPLDIEPPESLDEISDESFHWFSKEEADVPGPSPLTAR